MTVPVSIVRHPGLDSRRISAVSITVSDAQKARDQALNRMIFEEPKKTIHRITMGWCIFRLPINHDRFLPTKIVIVSGLS